MGLLSFLRRLFFGDPPVQELDGRPADTVAAHADPQPAPPPLKGRPRLLPLRFRLRQPRRTPRSQEISDSCPYTFATPHVAGRFLDLSTDSNLQRLERYRLPRLTTPAQLAEWLSLPLGRVAWLSGRFYENHRPSSVTESHYHYRWLRKRSGGHRLIEAPKQLLKLVQLKILRDILDHVPAHPRAFGFVTGRSAPQNAAQHVGQYVVLKFDLENFYPSVRYSRVVAIFRALGFSRVTSLWLARLTTTAAPSNLPFPDQNPRGIVPYLRRHLPQGAPTSPALANLSAYSLDVRLAGLARKYHATYSRYADDLTFSGSHRFAAALREFIPLVNRIVRDERFSIHKTKRKVIRRSARQTVTGAVVNEKLNFSRADYDRLKAILHNCVRKGPSTQNLDNREHFAAHLLGRIAYVESLNPARAQKLRRLYERIDWTK